VEVGPTAAMGDMCTPQAAKHAPPLRWRYLVNVVLTIMSVLQDRRILEDPSTLD
jgi:hypothetical protein